MVQLFQSSKDRLQSVSPKFIVNKENPSKTESLRRNPFQAFITDCKGYKSFSLLKPWCPHAHLQWGDCFVYMYSEGLYVLWSKAIETVVVKYVHGSPKPFSITWLSVQTQCSTRKRKHVTLGHLSSWLTDGHFINYSFHFKSSGLEGQELWLPSSLINSAWRLVLMVAPYCASL